MNIHHLELFYYVAKFGGISAAVRSMPYGIQQPSMSAQLARLEEGLGAKLFHRRPFGLTVEGVKLYEGIRGFFAQLPDLEASIREEGSQHLRIAACASVLKNHLPALLQRMKQERPGLRITLKEVNPDEVSGILVHELADVSVGVVHGVPPASLRIDDLVRVPLALLVPEAMKVKSLQDLLADTPTRPKTGKYPLISLPAGEVLTQRFQEGLAAMSVAWEPAVEVGTLEVVADYVRHGFGVGLAVEVPRSVPPESLKRIALPGFPPLRIAAMRRAESKPVVEWFLSELGAFVGKHLADTGSP